MENCPEEYCCDGSRAPTSISGWVKHKQRFSECKRATEEISGMREDAQVQQGISEKSTAKLLADGVYEDHDQFGLVERVNMQWTNPYAANWVYRKRKPLKLPTFDNGRRPTFKQWCAMEAKK